MGGCASTHHQHGTKLSLQLLNQHYNKVKIRPAGRRKQLPFGNSSPDYHNRKRQPVITTTLSDQQQPPLNQVVKVVYRDGRVEDFDPPVTAGEVMAGFDTSGTYLCSWEEMYVDECTPAVEETEELKAGVVYFVMPIMNCEKPLSLEDMCGLAIKASYGVNIDDFESPPSRPLPLFGILD